MASILEGVPDSEDASPTVLDWTKLKDGLKWKTIMQSERTAYALRNKTEEPAEDEYLWICLLAYLKEFKQRESQLAVYQAAQKQIKDQQTAVKQQLDDTTMELL